MPNVNIDVDMILTVAVDIIAFAGDQLIVLGNTVIGVIPAKDRARERHALPQLVLANPPDAAQMIDHVVSLYKKHGPCTARFLNVLTGIPANERYSVKVAQDRLLRSKRLVALTDERYPKYMVADTAQG